MGLLLRIVGRESRPCLRGKVDEGWGRWEMLWILAAKLGGGRCGCGFGVRSAYVGILRAVGGRRGFCGRGFDVLVWRRAPSRTVTEVVDRRHGRTVGWHVGLKKRATILALGWELGMSFHLARLVLPVLLSSAGTCYTSLRSGRLHCSESPWGFPTRRATA